jgi:hypothetical protein
MDNAKGSKMNERIKELLAELDIDLYTDEGVMMTKILVRPKDLRQFAELIVRECVAQCEFVAGQAEITNTGEMARKTKATANNCARMIEQHLGVEE